MYLEKPIEELMKLIEESGYSTYASWKIQHEMEEAKRLYDYLIEVQGVPDEETLKRGMSVVVVRYYLFLLNRLKYILPYDAMGCQFSVPLFLLEEFRDENILEKIKNFGGIYTWLESCELEHEIQKFITVHLDPRGIILYMDILSHRRDKNDIMPEPAVKLSMEKWITKKNGTEYACS